jgi:uncharacterized protein with von Willebrand factor type A (vWA) domain
MSSAPPDPVRVAARLTTALRHEGIPIGIDRVQAFVEGAALSGDLYWAGRLTLLGRVEEIPVYDRVFHGLLSGPLSLPAEQDLAELLPEDGEESQREGERDIEQVEASAIELLRHTAFEALTEEEVAQLARALALIRRRPPQRRVRRRRPSDGGRLDLRRTVRDMHRLGGEVALPRYAAPSVRTQQLTFLLDVSGSMSDATRGLLLACASFVRADRAHEAFTFGTRLTRITPALRRGSLSEGIAAASALAQDREGGTRIGESLQEADARDPRGGRGDLLRRAGDGRPRAARTADAAARAARPPGRMAEPAQCRRGLRTARPRHARGAAVPRRVRRWS